MNISSNSILYMDILQSLKERDAKFTKDKIWACREFCSRRKISNISRIQELKKSIESTKSQINKINEDLFANSEQGKLIRDINEGEKSLAHVIKQNTILKEQHEGLKVQVEALKAKQDPMVIKERDLKEREINITKAITEITAQLQTRSNLLKGERVEFEKTSQQFSSLSLEQEKLQSKLMLLKEREVDLRNDLFSSPSLPKIDVSAKKVRLPQAPDSAPASIQAEQAIAESNYLSNISQGNSQKRHTQPVTSIAFANSKPFLATGGEDAAVIIVNTETYRRVLHPDSD